MTRPLYEGHSSVVAAADIATHVRTKLNLHKVTRADIVNHYEKTNVPDMTIVFVYLGSRNVQADAEITDEGLVKFAAAGQAISDYIDTELADDHPTDKRFLLRHMELLCFRYGLSRFTSTGFGHDVIYSRTPIAENYPKFDNTLYVPPLIGHWAIASKGAARD
jgi:hypothetical protein